MASVGVLHLTYMTTASPAVPYRYYFELRSIADEAERPFPLELMSKEQAARLEASSKHIKDAVSVVGLRGAKSMDHKEFLSKAVLF